ncbi:MAG: serine hydrolase [Flavobacteriales bacterium]|nr:serine hydrolase [Flavobacteriales bacterium]
MNQLKTLTSSALLVFGSLCPALEASAQGALDNYISSQMVTQHISGLAAVLVRDNAIIWYGNYGLADRDAGIPVTDSTIFMLASVSKTITATALMQLVEDGLVGLDDPVNDHIPFTVVNPNHPDSVITIKQLLTHTSSIQDNWDLMPYSVGDPTTPLGDFLFDYLDASGANYDPVLNYNSFAPNSTYQYCNIGYALCGYVVEEVSGMPFNVYCNLNIFQPLCMDNTGWFLSEVDTTLVARPYTYAGGIYTDEGLYGYADYPDGQLRTTALSLAKFMYSHMNQGHFDGVQLLDTATADLMLTPAVPDIEPAQGLCFGVFDDAYGTWWNHTGGDLGVSTIMHFDVATNTGLLILTNGDGNFWPIRNRIMLELDDLVNEHVADVACTIVLPVSTPELVRPAEVQLYPNPAEDHFSLPAGTCVGVVRITDMTGKVVLTQTCSSRIDVRHLDPGTYHVVIGNDRMESVSRLVKL